MKQKILGVFVVFASVFFTMSQVGQVYAASCLGEYSINFAPGNQLPEVYNAPTTLGFTLNGVSANGQYSLYVISHPSDAATGGTNVDTAIATAAETVSFSVSPGAAFPTGFDYLFGYDLFLTGSGIEDGGCKLWDYTLDTDLLCNGSDIRIYQGRNEEMCYYQDGVPGSCILAATQVGYGVKNLSEAGSPYNGKININVWQGASKINTFDSVTVVNGETSAILWGNGVTAERHRVTIEKENGINICTTNFTPSLQCGENLCLSEEDVDNETAETIGPDIFKLCSQVKDPAAYDACTACAGGEEGTAGIWTAIGCISREPEEIVGKLIRLGLSMGGGIALLMILSAGFTLTVSQGNPQKAGQAKEMITAAVTGLLFIIFSVTILQFIGFSILKIPGFGGP